MKTADTHKKIKQHLLPRLQDYQVNKDLLYKIEPDLFLKGYAFESTGNDEYDLAVWCFVQPLFVKSDCLYFNFGNRLKYKKKISLFRSKELEWWDARKENLDISFNSILQSILKYGEEYLNSFKSPVDFFNKFKSSKNSDAHTYRAVAYTSALLYDNNLTDKMLKGLLNYCNKEIKHHNENISEAGIKEDALLLSAGSQQKRLEILRAWSNDTLSLVLNI